MSEENEKIGQSLPSRTIALATDYLAKVVVEDVGVRNGQTALFLDLIYTISRHAKKQNDAAEELPDAHRGPGRETHQDDANVHRTDQAAAEK